MSIGSEICFDPLPAKPCRQTGHGNGAVESARRRRTNTDSGKIVMGRQPCWVSHSCTDTGLAYSSQPPLEIHTIPPFRAALTSLLRQTGRVPTAMLRNSYVRKAIGLLILSLSFAAAPSVRAQTFTFVNTASSGAEDQSWNDSSRTTGQFTITAGNAEICFARLYGPPLTLTFTDRAGNLFSSPIFGGNQGSTLWEMSYSIATHSLAADEVTVGFGAKAPYGDLLCGQYALPSGYTWAVDSTVGPAAAYYTSNGTTMTSLPFSTAQPVELLVNCDTSGADLGSGGEEYFAGKIGGFPVAGAYFDTNGGLGGGGDQMCQYLTTSSPQTDITAVATLSLGYTPWGTQVMGFYGVPSGPPPPPPALSLSLSLSSGTVGQGYSGSASASGGTPPYSYISTTLPAGLSIAASTGAVSGTPTANGTTSVTVTATDSSSPVKTVSQTVSVTIAPAPETPLSLSAVLPGGTVGQAYSGTSTASGGKPPYTYTSATLPAGTSIAPSSGNVTGTPTASGTDSATVTVTDSSSPIQTVQQTVSVVIAPAPVVVPPPPPTASSLTLYWTPVSGATSYVVLRGASTGNLTQVATVAGTSYADATVTAGSSYYYEVESVAPNGATSLASQPLYITVQ